MIRVDTSRCLGCQSCTNVCPSQNIIKSETDGKWTVHWKRCKEECDLCVEMCPTRALTLMPWDQTEPEGEVSFDLVACKICGSRDATGLEWIRICPVCRRNIEAERMVKQILPGRRKDWRCSWLFQAGKRGLHPGRMRLLYDLIVFAGMLI
jgi:Pyruvate/2-oxoacid:ferredoxin oxidoreductase delta subunit